MAGITVVLDRKELVVRMEAETMRVDRPDGRLQRFPLAMIERVVVVGRPMVSCDVWRALAGRKTSRRSCCPVGGTALRPISGRGFHPPPLSGSRSSGPLKTGA